MSDAMPQMLRWYMVLPDGRYVPIEDAAMRGVRPTPPHTPAEPQPEFTIPEGWRRLQVGEILQPGDQIVQIDDGGRYPTHRVGDAVGKKQQYIRRIESEPVPQTETQPQPVQVREGRWRTRGGEVKDVRLTPPDKGFAIQYPWWDGDRSWNRRGSYLDGFSENPMDLLDYLGPIEVDKTQLEPPSVKPPGPPTLRQIIQRCEANETTFDNQDMSVVLQEVYRLRRIIISQFE